jgi:hypothetical protein
MVPWYPCFIDVEASGFGAGSWPVSVAWCDHRGDIGVRLLRPDPTWTHWDAEAESVHGLSRRRLDAEGRDPAEVAAGLEADLRDGVAYSDAPDFDARWLAALYRVLGRPMPFRIEHADDVLVQALHRPHEMQWQTQARLERAKDELRATARHRHDAGFDVGFLVALWRRAQGETVKMNHGIGPVPEVTATGSFRRGTG